MPLPIVTSGQATVSKKRSHGRVELEAKYERVWFLNPCPHVSLIEKEKREHFWQFIETILQDSFHVADLACGAGFHTKKLLDLGAKVDAIDVASNALKLIPPHSRLRTFHQAVPRTTLDDFAYDLVIAPDIIPELHLDDYRLFTSEVQRLMKRTGVALISSNLDYKTEDPLRVFLALLSSEFKVQSLVLSHHSLYLSCFKILEFLKLEKSKIIFNAFESVTRFLKPESGISYVIAKVEKKPLN